MIIAIPKEVAAGERRVALVPDGAKALIAAGHEVHVQRGAGEAAGAFDAAYEAAGARIADEVLADAELVLKVQTPDEAELASLRPGTALVALLRPLDEPARIADLAERGLTAFALELIPRIARAQSMDVLSSQATVAGYRAVLVAAEMLPRMFPMLVTAAGTISPARVFVIGAGVAGLQAIATARRLGAVVEAYDTRVAAAEQIGSLGGRFVSLALDVGDAEDAGGYAREQSEGFYEKQRALMAEVAARSDIVITTALVPGKKSPLLIDTAGIRGMRAGSVVVDLAAAGGGNCEPTQADQEVNVDGVRVLGPTNLPSDLSPNASQMLSKNVVTLVLHLTTAGDLALDLDDEITDGALVTHAGKIRVERVRAALEGGA